MKFREFGEKVPFEPHRVFSGERVFMAGDSKGSVSSVVEGSQVAFKGSAEGEIDLQLKGGSCIKRHIVVPAGKSLFLSFRSFDSAIVEDVVHVLEGATLTYDGRFRDAGDFSVHVIHGEPNARSSVEVKGIARGDAALRTTGEVLPGSDGSELSVSSTVVVFGNGKVKAVPELKISNPDTKSFHSFKKIRLNTEQLFYLQSRGFAEEGIEKLYEKLVMGD